MFFIDLMWIVEKERRHNAQVFGRGTSTHQTLGGVGCDWSGEWSKKQVVAGLLTAQGG